MRTIREQTNLISKVAAATTASFLGATDLKMRSFLTSLLEKKPTVPNLVFCIGALNDFEVRLMIEKMASGAEESFLMDFRNSIYSKSTLQSEIYQFLAREDSGVTIETFLEATRPHLICNDPGALRRLAEFEEKLHTLQQLLELNYDEVQLLAFLHCVNSMEEFKEKYNMLMTFQRLEATSAAINVPPKSLMDMTMPESRLRKCGLIETQPFIGDVYRDILSEQVSLFLEGLSESPIQKECNFYDKEKAIPLNKFDLKSDSLSILQKVLDSKRPVNILLYGEPGTGKTELARALAASMSKKLMRTGYGITNTRDFPLYLQVACVTSTKEDILLVDEADCLLNTWNFQSRGALNADKSWINYFLESHDRKIIWITNHVDGMEKSVRRRFDYCLGMKNVDSALRQKIWKRTVKDLGLQTVFKPGFVKKISNQYPVNIAGITSAAGLIKDVCDAGQQCSTSDVEEILRNRVSLLEGEMESKYESGSKCLIGAIHSSPNAGEVLNGLSRIEKRSVRTNGIALLFHGAPGTGKSELAHYLADKLKKPLIQKYASDILSKFVGSTEENIARAFREARDCNGILLLDEVDSILSSRSGARQSWERTQVNELLHQLERYPGIVICTTNDLDVLDRAAMRRFALKVRFKDSLPKDREALFRHFFNPRSVRCTKYVRGVLSRMNGLRPGDFAAVNARLCLKENLDAGEILNELQSELDYRSENKKVTGFLK